MGGDEIFANTLRDRLILQNFTLIAIGSICYFTWLNYAEAFYISLKQNDSLSDRVAIFLLYFGWLLINEEKKIKDLVFSLHHSKDCSSSLLSMLTLVSSPQNGSKDVRMGNGEPYPFSEKYDISYVSNSSCDLLINSIRAKWTKKLWFWQTQHTYLKKNIKLHPKILMPSHNKDATSNLSVIRSQILDPLPETQTEAERLTQLLRKRRIYGDPTSMGQEASEKNLIFGAFESPRFYTSPLMDFLSGTEN